MLDAMIIKSVVDKDLATPPSSPAAGVLYIVAASPTGAWAGKATSFAYFDQIWRFITPLAGTRVWVQDEASDYLFTGTAWNICTYTGAARGTVSIGAAASSLVVSNAFCTTSSLVFAVIRTNDSTALIKNVVPAAGSFTITLNAAATAATSVGYMIIN